MDAPPGGLAVTPHLSIARTAGECNNERCALYGALRLGGPKAVPEFAPSVLPRRFPGPFPGRSASAACGLAPSVAEGGDAPPHRYPRRRPLRRRRSSAVGTPSLFRLCVTAPSVRPVRRATSASGKVPSRASSPSVQPG